MVYSLVCYSDLRGQVLDTGLRLGVKGPNGWVRCLEVPVEGHVYIRVHHKQSDARGIGFELGSMTGTWWGYGEVHSVGLGGQGAVTGR